MSETRLPAVVIGAGPAGLGAAWQLARRGSFEVTVIERHSAVGGNAGSFDLDGLRVDYGSHRLHPSIKPEILSDIRAMLGGDLLDRPRHGRIRLHGRWVHFPLEPLDLALHLPPSFIAGVALDSVRKASSKAPAGGESFADVLERGLGRTICRDFYFPYAEKIWGLPPTDLDAEQARRRVSAGSVAKMLRRVLNAVPGMKPPGAGRFFYPRQGYGQISEAYAGQAVRAGVSLRLDTELVGVETHQGRVRAVAVRSPDREERLPAQLVLSTIPLVALVRSLAPGPPEDLLRSASSLRSRAMILIYLVLDVDRFTEFDAHYFPSRDVLFTRMHEPKNYSLADVPGTTVLCIELPCSTDDHVWTRTDDELGRMVRTDLETVGLPVRQQVKRVITRRLREAYPIYTKGYRAHFDRLDGYAAGFQGLMTLGRQGLFAHDNTHHTLEMAYAAVECVNDDGTLQRDRWEHHRRAFESHVVED